jgi:hypothetical protein
LVYFSHFGTLYQKKSGNPAPKLDFGFILAFGNLRITLKRGFLDFSPIFRRRCEMPLRRPGPTQKYNLMDYFSKTLNKIVFLLSKVFLTVLNRYFSLDQFYCR